MSQLDEIEAIKRLKARYFRHMDTSQWDKWGQTFTEDAELHNPVNRDVPLRGREQIVATVSGNMQGVVSVHHGHMPEIVIESPTEARGIWAMHDILIGPVADSEGRGRLEGYGHYIERYRKDPDGEWRIARLELRRLHLATERHARTADASLFGD